MGHFLSNVESMLGSVTLIGAELFRANHGYFVYSDPAFPYLVQNMVYESGELVVRRGSNEETMTID